MVNLDCIVLFLGLIISYNMLSKFINYRGVIGNSIYDVLGFGVLEIEV